MYACVHEPDSGFLAGCALPAIARSFLVTHPHHPAIREWYCASTRCPVVLTTANLYSLLQYHPLPQFSLSMVSEQFRLVLTL